MIEQQINLYHDRFRQKRQFLTAVQTAMLTFIVLVALLGYSAHLKMELERVVSANVAIQQQQKTVAEELILANAELNRLLADTRFDDQISNVSREIRARQKVIEFVDGDRFGSSKGFSDYLVSLASLHIDNIWLTEIRLSSGYVRIKGSSLSEDIVPTYFDQFSQESVFAGNRFDLFRLNRDDATSWKIDFEIASEEGLND